MSYQWLRLWVDAIDDEKLKLLAFEDRWHFIALLCCKRKGILDGEDSPAMVDRKVGVKLGLADRERDEVRRRLIEVGLIDARWQPCAWAKRQFTSDTDPTAADRKRKQRERERHGTVTRDDTPESRAGHGAQTQNQTAETDSREEQDKNSAPSVAPDTRRGTRVPADPNAILTPSVVEWAAHEAADVDVPKALAEFCDYWRTVPGTRGRKLEWPLAFMNRLRELQGRARGRPVAAATRRAAPQLLPET